MLSLFKKKSAASPSLSTGCSPSAKSSKKKNKKKKKSKSTSKTSSSNTTGGATALEFGHSCTKGEVKDDSYSVWTQGPSDSERRFKGDKWPASGYKAAEEFMKRYAEMGPDGIKAEFKKEVVDYFGLKATASPTSKHAAFDANPDKNRDNTLIACLDDSRVLLSNKKYINASLTGEMAKLTRKYILTQVPMESTIADFWQMVYEQNHCFCAFVLAPELTKENAYKPTAPFWPTCEKETQVYGKYTVTNESDECLHDYDSGMEMHWHYLRIVRKDSPDKYKNIRIGYLYQWAPDFTVDRASSINNVMHEMSKIFFTDGTIILMDDHSGTGIAAVFMIVDAVRELFHSGASDIKLPSMVQWARRCRANAIRSEEEYLEVVKTIGEYLATFAWQQDNQEMFKEQLKKICGAELEKKK